MDKIIFSYSCHKPIHRFVIDALCQILREKYDIETTINNLATGRKYKAILCFNQKGYQKVRKFIKQNDKIPLFYLFCNGDFANEYPFDKSPFNRIIVIKNTPYSNNGNLLFYKQFDHINIPFPIDNITNKSIAAKENKVMVNISDDSVILENITTINLLSSFYNNIIVVSNNSKIKKLLHANIKLMKRNESVKTELIKSKFVIASKEEALLSLLHNIPTLIIGQYGFGQFVSNDNVETLYNTGFNGRIGGAFGELVPSNYILDEIREYLNEEKIINGTLIQEWLRNEHTLLEKRLVSMIEKEEKIKTNYWNLSFILNPDYNYYLSGNRYIITDTICKKELFIIESEEYTIINSFANQTTPQEIFKQFSYFDESEFRCFVLDLICSKLIISNYE